MQAIFLSFRTVCQCCWVLLSLTVPVFLPALMAWLRILNHSAKILSSKISDLFLQFLTSPLQHVLMASSSDRVEFLARGS